jgi:hypothetical protein
LFLIHKNGAIARRKNEKWIFLMHMFVKKTNIFRETDILRAIWNGSDHTRNRRLIWTKKNRTQEWPHNMTSLNLFLLPKFKTHIILKPQFCTLPLSFKNNSSHNPIFNAIHRKELQKSIFSRYKSLSESESDKFSEVCVKECQTVRTKMEWAEKWKKLIQTGRGIASTLDTKSVSSP